LSNLFVTKEYCKGYIYKWQLNFYIEGEMMATILVDYENVHGCNGLKEVETLCSDDILILFYSEACRRIKREYMQQIIDSRCRFRIMKLKNTGKNALDFYIAVECGRLSANREKQIATDFQIPHCIFPTYEYNRSVVN